MKSAILTILTLKIQVYLKKKSDNNLSILLLYHVSRRCLSTISVLNIGQVSWMYLHKGASTDRRGRHAMPRMLLCFVFLHFFFVEDANCVRHRKNVKAVKKRERKSGGVESLQSRLRFYVVWHFRNQRWLPPPPNVLGRVCCLNRRNQHLSPSFMSWWRT